MSYRGPEGKVELLGVCSVTETEIKCWGPDRKPQKEVLEMVKQRFESNESVSVPVKFGKKTRLAVFKFTIPPASQRKSV